MSVSLSRYGYFSALATSLPTVLFPLHKQKGYSEERLYEYRALHMLLFPLQIQGASCSKVLSLSYPSTHCLTASPCALSIAASEDAVRRQALRALESFCSLILEDVADAAAGKLLYECVNVQKWVLKGVLKGARHLLLSQRKL